jgi:hypothetical protein
LPETKSKKEIVKPVEIIEDKKNLPLNPQSSSTFLSGSQGDIMTNEHNLQIRIISTWGSINQAGLTEIQVFDDQGIKLEVKPSNFHLRNCGITSIKNIDKLTNGKIYTTDEENMWICNMPAPPVTPEIFLSIKHERPIAALRIWNYNKSMIESIKGIKDVEVVYNGALAWIGILNRGSGNEFEEYVTEIYFKDRIKLPTLQIPTDNYRITPPPVIGKKNEEEFNLDAYKQDALSKNRPISVPIWLEDANLKGSVGLNNNMNLKNLPDKSDKFTPDLRSSRQSEITKKDLTDPVSKLTQSKAEAFSSYRFDEPRSEYQTLDDKPRSSRIKNHPKVGGVFEEMGLPKRSMESLPLKVMPELEKVPRRQEIKNKDDNQSINSIEFFNITNFGRLRPAKRESLMQVINLKQDVKETIKNVEKLINFKTDPIPEEGDVLSQFTRDKSKENLGGKVKSTLQEKSNPSLKKDPITNTISTRSGIKNLYS